MYYRDYIGCQWRPLFEIIPYIGCLRTSFHGHCRRSVQSVNSDEVFGRIRLEFRWCQNAISILAEFILYKMVEFYRKVTDNIDVFQNSSRNASQHWHVYVKIMKMKKFRSFGIKMLGLVGGKDIYELTGIVQQRLGKNQGAFMTAGASYGIRRKRKGKKAVCMKKYQVYQVDAFTRCKFHGNPAGVVPHADGLSAEQMQQIARELNNSETAFLFSAASSDYDVEVRFFTPLTEVPLCGHATIAAHYVRALIGDAAEGKYIQKTKAGLLPVEILRPDHDYVIRMTQGQPEVQAPLAAAVVRKIAAALGIQGDDIRRDCPVAIASAGHSKVMIGIQSNRQLHALQPDLTALAAISGEIGCNGYYVFTLNPGDAVFVHGRMFAPAIGIAEDPVTGNANGPLGLYLVHYRICPEMEHDQQLIFSVLQGEAMHRDGGMQVIVDIVQNKPVLVRIIGEAVVAFSTEVEI